MLKVAVRCLLDTSGLSLFWRSAVQISWNRWVPEVSSFLSPLASVVRLGVRGAQKQMGLVVPRALEPLWASSAEWAVHFGCFRAGKRLFLKTSGQVCEGVGCKCG